MMKRVLVIVLLILAVWHMSVYADEGAGKNRSFVEGLEYQIFEPPLAIQTEHLPKDQIEVVILFLYACPHCNALDSKLTAWAEQKGGRIVLKRIPAIVGAPWADQARAFYTAEKLGILEKAHVALFKSIHDEGVQYADDQSVMDFFVKQGVKPENFIDALQSPEVAEKVSQARVMAVEYGIRGVPALIVNGKYLTAQYLTGTQEKLMDVLEMLVDKELNASQKS